MCVCVYVCMCETRSGWIGDATESGFRSKGKGPRSQSGRSLYEMIVIIFGSGPDVYAPSCFISYSISGHGLATDELVITICLSHCLTFFRNLRQP